LYAFTKNGRNALYLTAVTTNFYCLAETVLETSTTSTPKH